MLDRRTDFNCLIDAPSVGSAVASRDVLVVRSLAATLVHVRILGRFVSPRVGSVLAFGVGVQLRNNLHGVVVLSGSHVYFSVGGAQLG